jgi:hypothetical protein
VICGTCGERMSVRYRAHRNQSVPTYCCGRGLLQRGESGMCQTLYGGVLDRAISEIVIEAMTPLAIEVALTVQQELATRHEEADWSRRQHMERPRYSSPFRNVAGLRYPAPLALQPGEIIPWTGFPIIWQPNHGERAGGHLASTRGRARRPTRHWYLSRELNAPSP